MTEAGKGVAGVIGACVIWGISPLYYKQLSHVPPLEVLAHRTLWSLVFFGLIILARRRWGEVAALLGRPRQLLPVALAALFISCNWGLFIWSVQTDQALDASLGYYIFPLVSVLLGVVFYGEGWGGAKLLAVGLAATGVLVLTIGLGAAPWVSLTLAVTFGFYGLLKKSVPAGPVISVTSEVLLLTPLAVIWIWGVHNLGWTGLTGRNLATFGHSLSDSLLLMLSGPLTASPLILFSYGARRVTMSTVGLVQYLNPTIQFSLAVLVFAEPLTRWHAIAFPLIWCGLAIYSLRALAVERSARRASSSSSTVASEVK